jgi:hypothetical protein
MNPETQSYDEDDGAAEVTRIYPPQVDCSVSSNVKCMMHQFVDAAGEKRLILSMEPGEYRLVYTNEFRSGFHSMRVLSGAVVLEGPTARIEASEGTVHRIADDRAFTFSSNQFTQLQLSDSRPLDETESDDAPDVYRDRFWMIAMPRPKGPTPPRRNMMVSITPGQDGSP